MLNRGKKIVLAASTSESSEYQNSTWRQMLLGTLPARYSRFPFYMIDINWQNDLREDGQAVAVPNGLRVVESILLEKFSAEDIAICHPDQLELFVGEDTKVVGVHAHNPLGITFATDVYVNFTASKPSRSTRRNLKDWSRIRSSQNIGQTHHFCETTTVDRNALFIWLKMKVSKI